MILNLKLALTAQQLRAAIAIPIICASLQCQPAPAFSMPPLVASAMPINTLVDNNNPNTGSAVHQKEKTVYLIRHAESLENVAYQGARAVQASYSERKLPQLSDVIDAFALAFKAFRPAVMNAALSETGETQVKQLYDNLQRDRFVEQLVQDQQSKGDDLSIVHSPLVRAKQTAYGSLLGPVHLPPNDKVQSDEIPGIRLQELASLREVNPIEIIGDAIQPWKSTKTIDGRIEQFEAWLEEQKEDTIIVVGHSVYFKRMLNLPETFNNCDVWVAKYGEPENESGLATMSTTAIETSKAMMADMVSGKDSEMNTDLPRKWKSLQRLYRYTPEMQVREVDDSAMPSLMMEQMSQMMSPGSSKGSSDEASKK